MLLIREGGLYIAHYAENNNQKQALRSFTSDTVPFSNPDSKFPLAAPRINVQECLLDAFLMLRQPYEPNPIYNASSHDSDALSKETLMAAQNNLVYKELALEGLGQFTAYTNRTVKVVFEDRTLLRLTDKSDVVKLINRRGEEVVFGLKKEQSHLQQEYGNYVKVGEDFFEWAFSSPEMRALKEQAETQKQQAIAQEMEKIQRTLYVLDQNSSAFQREARQAPSLDTCQSEIEENASRIAEIEQLLRKC